MDIASFRGLARARASMPAVIAALLAACATHAERLTGRGDIRIDGKGVHPESITSTADGSLFAGSLSGTIYRAGPRDTTATPFITPTAQNGLRSVFGVLADEAAGRLWVCSVANSFARPAGPAQPSEVAAFDLKSGALVGRWPFPAPGGTCNDIAIGPDGAAYATDTPGGRILKLARGANALQVVAAHESLRGIDGLAFAADGKLYINNVQRHELWRVGITADPNSPQLTLLTATRKMGGPDGIRPIGGNRFLQAEGTSGAITLVTISGDTATIEPIREGLGSTPSVTLVGDTVYTAEGKIEYLINPQLRGQDPGEFRLIAIPFSR